MKDNCFSVGIVEKIEQLVGSVAVIRIEERQTCFESGVAGGEEICAIVQVDADFGIAAQANLDQARRQGIGVRVEVGP